MSSDKKNLLKIILFIIGIVFFGSLLSGSLFMFGKKLAQNEIFNSIIGLSWVAEKMADSSFPRYFNRSILITTIILAIPLGISIKIKKLSELNLNKDLNWIKRLTISFVVAFILLFLLGLSLYYYDNFKIRSIIKWENVLNAFITGMVVGCLEEFLFRGVLLGFTIKVFNKHASAIVISIIFSLVHFIKPPSNFIINEENVSLLSGFEMLSSIGIQFSDPIFLLSNFATLFIVGLTLAYITLRTRSLWCAIGMHAGWIFGLRIFNSIYKWRGDLSETLPWFGNSLKIGLLPLLIILITYIIINILLKNNLTSNYNEK